MTDWGPVEDHGLTGVLADVVTIMTEVEAGHHDVGWDNSPLMLYHVTRSWKGEEPGYEMSPTPLGSTEDLLSLASAIHANPPEPSPLRPPVADIFVSEGWANDRCHAADARRLADVPGSVEVRFAVAVVESRHLMHLERVRGSEVVFRHARAATCDDTWGGRVFQALALIQCACRQT